MLAQYGTPTIILIFQQSRKYKEELSIGHLIITTQCYSSVTTMLHDLKWPTLQYRRQRARLSLFYKSLNNLMALQIPSYYIPNRHPSRLHHQLSYIHPYMRELMLTSIVYFQGQSRSGIPCQLECSGHL